MAWPNSCAAVPPSRKPRFMVAWLNGTLRASVPTVDQAPSFSSKVMRISASGAVPKSNLMLATADHHAAWVRAVACSAAEPPMKRTRKVEPLIQLLPLGAMARTRPPGPRVVSRGRSRSRGRMRSKQTFGAGMTGSSIQGTGSQETRPAEARGDSAPVIDVSSLTTRPLQIAYRWRLGSDPVRGGWPRIQLFATELLQAEHRSGHGRTGTVGRSLYRQDTHPASGGGVCR